VLALAGGAAAMWVFRDAVARTILQWERVPAPPGGPALLKPVPLEAVPPPADALDGGASADKSIADCGLRIADLIADCGLPI